MDGQEKLARTLTSIGEVHAANHERQSYGRRHLARWRPPVVSPDGKKIAYAYIDKTSGQDKIALIPFEGGAPNKVLDLDLDSVTERRTPFRWTPDGRSIAFIRTTNGVSNIWAQALAGGELKQLTVFKDQHIVNFAWSRDGRQLALSRGVANGDVVLITGFKQP